MNKSKRRKIAAMTAAEQNQRLIRECRPFIKLALIGSRSQVITLQEPTAVRAFAHLDNVLSLSSSAQDDKDGFSPA